MTKAKKSSHAAPSSQPVNNSDSKVSGGLRSRIVGHGREKAADILANPYNHRLHPEAQRQVVSASLEEIGWVKSIIVNRVTGHIVDGHERVMNALGRGDDTLVDVEYVELSPEEEKKALLVLDASSEMAKVDANALEQLASECNFDSDILAGLAQDMIADAGCGPASEVGDDDVPDLPVEPKSKLGDMWIMDGHRVLCGDSTNPDDVSRLLMGSSPQLMVTDPPYGVEYEPEWRSNVGLNDSSRMGVVKNDDKADWTEAYRLFPGSVAYVWHSALHSPEFYYSLERAGFGVRSQLIWVKPRLVISRGAYHWQHEQAYVAERGNVSVEPDSQPSASTEETDDENGVEAEMAWYGVRKSGKAYWCGGRKRTTVWNIEFKNEQKTVHGTQKPVECMSRPMMNHGRPGDTVYDPFLGSGTSIIAAEKTGRFCRGMELDPVYVDVIVARWEAFTGKKAVLAKAN